MQGVQLAFPPCLTILNPLGSRMVVSLGVALLSMPTLRMRCSAMSLREIPMVEALKSRLPARPPMVPGSYKDYYDEEEEECEVEEVSESEYDEEMELKAATSTVVMDRLKAAEDVSGVGFSAGSKAAMVRKRLWTRADFLHIHAVSGGYFLLLGLPWLVYSHVVNAIDPSVTMERSSTPTRIELNLAVPFL